MSEIYFLLYIHLLIFNYLTGDRFCLQNLPERTFINKNTFVLNSRAPKCCFFAFFSKFANNERIFHTLKPTNITKTNKNEKEFKKTGNQNF